jgi:hypothetical protein
VVVEVPADLVQDLCSAAHRVAAEAPKRVVTFRPPDSRGAGP